MATKRLDFWLGSSGLTIGLGSIAYTYREITRLETIMKAIQKHLARHIRLLERNLPQIQKIHAEFQHQLKELNSNFDELWSKVDAQEETLETLVDAIIEIQDIMREGGSDIQTQIYYRDPSPPPRKRRHGKNSKRRTRSKRTSRKKPSKSSESDESRSSEDTDDTDDIQAIMAKTRQRRNR